MKDLIKAFFFFLALLPSSRAFAVPFVDSFSTMTSSSAVYSWSHTVGIANTAVLVVSVAIPGGGNVTDITYDGVSLTYVNAEGPGATDGEIWFMQNPPVGTHDIEVTLSGAADTVAGGVSYGGCGNITSNFSATNQNSNNSISNTIITGTNNSVLSILAFQATPGISISPDSPATTVWYESNGMSVSQFNQVAGAAGSKTYGATFGSTGGLMIMALEVNNGPTLTSTFSPTTTPTTSPTPTVTQTAICVGISYDSSSYSAGTTTTQTWAHTVGTMANRVLVVGVQMNPGSSAVAGVTFNGASMTLGIAHQAVLGNQVLDGELWYLLNPDTGTHNIVVTHSGASNIVVGAVSYAGVGSVGATASQDNGPGNSISTNVSTSADGSYITYLAAQNRAITNITDGADQTVRWNQEYGADPDAVTSEQGDMSASLAGSYFLDFTFSQSQYNNLIALVLNPLCGATNTPTPTYTPTPTASPSNTNTPVYTPTFTPTASPTATESATDSPTPTDSPTVSPTPTPFATPTPGGTLIYFSASTTTATGNQTHIWTFAPGPGEGDEIALIIITATNSYGVQPLWSLERDTTTDTGAGYTTWLASPQRSEYGASTADIRTWPTPQTTLGTSIDGPFESDFTSCNGPLVSTCIVYWPFKNEELMVHHGEQLSISITNGVAVDNVAIKVKFYKIAE